jgi:hypothetical protein
MQHINDPAPDFGATLVNAFDAGGAGAQKIPTLAKHDLAQNQISMEHGHHQAPVHDISSPVHHQDVPGMDPSTQVGSFLSPHEKRGSRIGPDQRIKAQPISMEISPGSRKPGTSPKR